MLDSTSEPMLDSTSEPRFKIYNYRKIKEIKCAFESLNGNSALVDSKQKHHIRFCWIVVCISTIILQATKICNTICNSAEAARLQDAKICEARRTSKFHNGRPRHHNTSPSPHSGLSASRSSLIAGGTVTPSVFASAHSTSEAASVMLHLTIQGSCICHAT